MNNSLRMFLAIEIASTMLSSPSQATTFTEKFDGPSVSSFLQSTSSAGFSFDLAGGQGRFSKAQGSGYGSASLSTKFELIGDFSVDISVNRSFTTGSPDTGLRVQTPDGQTFAEVWVEPPQILSYDLGGPGFYSYRANATQAPVIDFNIRRTAGTIYLSANGGQSAYLSSANPQLAAPMSVTVFFSWGDSGYNGPSLAYFDNLVIQADSFSSAVPEPSNLSLLLGGLVCVTWFIRCSRRSRRHVSIWRRWPAQSSEA